MEFQSPQFADDKLAIRCIMIDLGSEIPYFYWTFNRLGDLEQGQNQYGFDGSVWKSDAISAYSIGEAGLTFDSPAGWAKGLPTVVLHRTAEGHYEHRSKGIIYEAVRADTLTHIVFTGRWGQTDVGNGVFVAVLPVKQDVKILLERAAAVSFESGIPVPVAHP